MILYFPGEFSDGSSNYFYELQRKSILKLKVVRISQTLKASDIHEASKLRETIKQIEQWELSLHSPKNFDNQSPDYFIKKIEKSFESLCIALEENGVQSPKKLTLFEFYSRLEYFKKKRKQKSKHHEQRF